MSDYVVVYHFFNYFSTIAFNIFESYNIFVMNKLKIILSVAVCKLSRNLIRLMGRGGTDMPGRLALKICPDLLKYLAKDVTTLIVTGTNGKTTSSRMLEQCLVNNGCSYIANKSGANLLSGITAEFAANASLTGKMSCDYALIEADEAAFKMVGLYTNPKYVLVTNVFRDQLDRYGEITHTLNNIRIGLERSPEATVCINGDCSLSASLKDDIPNKVIFFGVNVPIYKEMVAEVSDAPYCIRCKTEYKYEYRTYGHLGGYYCPKCGYRRPEPSVAVTEIISTDETSSKVVMNVAGRDMTVDINLPGGYNIYNAAGVMTIATAAGFSPESAVSALSDFECGFGRMEKFEMNGSDVQMILIKNPAGCNQVLNFLANLDTPSAFTVCLNDNYADGTDISWIWDVNFEGLLECDDMLTDIFISGKRADDMALRFKYAGFNTDKLHVIKDYDRLIDAIEQQEHPCYIMPTYTAMLDLREKISTRYGLKDYWK